MKPNQADVSLSIRKLIDSLSPSASECCIFRVHNELRLVNEKAYEPEIVAIGPYHGGEESKDRLQMMEEHKLLYFQVLLQRNKELSIGNLVDAVILVEEEARKFYAEPVKLDGNELTRMLVLDGCFIIELLRKFEIPHLRAKDDLIFKMDWIVNILQRDLLLFENQIPFTVLLKLFDLIEVPGQHQRLIHLVLKFFRDLLPGQGCRENTNNDSHLKIKHLLGLMHNNWLPSFAGTPWDEENKKWRFIPCATALQEAGVKFKKQEQGNLFDIKFENGVMQIPPLTIEDRTETFFRNLIAYEQYGSDNHLTYVTDYVKFMDCLIDSAKDVEILCQHVIIDKWLGDDEAVCKIFNTSCASVTGPGEHFHYIDIFKRVNIHCNKRRHRWMAKLRRNYLNSPWGLISIIAATALLLLTVTQTVFAILGS